MAALKKDSFMKKCCMCGDTDVEWHHNLIIAGRQVDNPLSILPLCKEHHRMADDTLVKEELDHVMLLVRGFDIRHYPKSNLEQRRRYLIRKYGN